MTAQKLMQYISVGMEQLINTTIEGLLVQWKPIQEYNLGSVLTSFASLSEYRGDSAFYNSAHYS